MLIDTHAHLDEQAFDSDLPEVLARAKAAGVEAILTIGVTLASSESALLLAKAHPQVHAVVGIQPNYVAQAGPDDLDMLAALATDPHVVGVGETGLDRYWDHSPLDLQREYFFQHIELSRQVDKPFVVHCREAEADVVDVLEQAARSAPLHGVMHSYAGDADTAARCVELGLFISFAGMLTFKNNQTLRDVARQVRLERLLVETDSPYLSPVPLRGKRNEPANVVHTCRTLAEVFEMTPEEMAAQTTRNARELFGLPQTRSTD